MTALEVLKKYTGRMYGGGFMSHPRNALMEEMERDGLIVTPGITGDMQRWTVTDKGYALIGREKK